MYIIFFSKIEYQERKKAEGKKARDDKEAVLNVLFAAFEKHQYYNIKDLQKVIFFINFILFIFITLYLYNCSHK